MNPAETTLEIAIWHSQWEHEQLIEAQRKILLFEEVITIA